MAAGAALGAPPTWVVEDGDARAYLVGTIHMLPEDAQWWSKPFAQAFSEIDTLWLEIDLSAPPDIFPLMERYALAEDGLSAVLDAADTDALDALLARFGMDIVQMEGVQPWFAYLQVSALMTQDLGMDPNLGIDMRLMTQARRQGVPVGGLETFEHQFATLSGLSEELQVALLREVVAEFDTASAELGTQMDGWISGDLHSVEAATVEMSASQPEFYEALFASRNRGFVDGIEAILAEGGTSMIAVGLGHFVGPEAIPELLEARGYTVERWTP